MYNTFQVLQTSIISNTRLTLVKSDTIHAQAQLLKSDAPGLTQFTANTRLGERELMEFKDVEQAQRRTLEALVVLGSAGLQMYRPATDPLPCSCEQCTICCLLCVSVVLDTESALYGGRCAYPLRYAHPLPWRPLRLHVEIHVDPLFVRP